MNSDPQEFAFLRRLLKLKRYEQPPPRYFNEFSGLVISRIKAGGRDRSADALEELALTAQWWRRLLGAFQQGPVLAGTCAAGVCALLIVGAIYTEKSSPATPGMGYGDLQQQAVATAPPVFGTVTPMELSQTNAADSSLSGSRFFDVQLRTEPVRGNPPGR